MFKKFNTPMKSTAILSLVLTFAMGVAWAVQTYSASKVIKEGNGGQFWIVNAGPDKIGVQIYDRSLDDYMADEGINEVEITADMEEEWVDQGGGNGHYRLTFTLGPSGAYFEPDALELKLQGKYSDDGNNVRLYDENGEAIESESNGNSGQMIYYIDHFSSYSYDDYDY